MTTPFNTRHAIELNEARIENLDKLDLKLEKGSRVLDCGCGDGYFIQYFIDRGCQVTAFDGRRENVLAARKKYPNGDVTILELPIENITTYVFPRPFDLIFCYGLLYHLKEPISAIFRLADICSKYMLIETLVCDANFPVVILESENKDQLDQSLDGIGSRPSPSFITIAMRAAGFKRVTIPNNQPRHRDYFFTEMNNLDVIRDNHRLRKVIIGEK